MSNLGLWNGPGGPAYNYGQTMTEDDLNNQIKRGMIDSTSLANQQSQAMNPLLVQQQDLVNTLKGIQNRRESGLADTSEAAGTIAKAGVDDNVAVNHQEAMSKLGSEGIKQVQQVGEALGQTGLMIGQMPKGPHVNAFAGQAMTKMGIGDDSPLHQAIIALPSEEVGPALVNLSTQMANHTSQHLNMMDTLNAKGQNALGVAQTNAASREAIATDKNATILAFHEMDNASKQKVKQMGDDILLQLQKNKVLNTDQLVAKTKQEYEDDKTQENLDRYNRAIKAKQDSNGVSGKLIEAYMNGELTHEFLPQAKNTRVNPNTTQGATNWPTGTQIPATTPGAPNIGTSSTPPPATQPSSVTETDPDKITDAQIVANLSVRPEWKGHSPQEMIAAFRAKHRK